MLDASIRAGAPRRRVAPAAAVKVVPECFASNLYFDRDHGLDAAKILPGEYYVTGREMVLVTVLGSCVAACIRDPRLGIGGINHFMLPDSELAEPAGAAARYGTFAMEMLINHLLKLGARRDQFEAKVFGGGNVIAGMTQANVGQRNAEFVMRFMRTEDIRVAAKDLAGIYPRKIYYFPATGRTLVKRLRNVHNNTIFDRERDYSHKLDDRGVGGDVELFT